MREIKIKPLPIEEFIEIFKKGFNEEELVKTFTQGNCYHFAVILKDIYPDGVIEYDYVNGHFIFNYEGKYYDITGEVSVMDTYIFDVNKMDQLEYYRILRDCVYKINYYPYVENEYYKEEIN